MTNLFTSFMRTVVPIAAAVVLGLAGKIGLDLDVDTVTLYVAAGLAAGYYALWRSLEALAGRIGWEPLRTLAGLLLGWARPPQYQKPTTIPIKVRLDFDAASFSEKVAGIAERGGGELR
ncbi:hypothetical protein ACIHFC_28730 [Streptomyces sp. NPDC052013]|uniref:hypothetical protein n=1 Tax=Streptomyces sp. NPDC052013 TaxID=3365679 RepID=UPI0037D67979